MTKPHPTAGALRAQWLIDDDLPNITRGLVTKTDTTTVIDQVELDHRHAWVEDLEQSARTARNQLEELQALLAYEDVEPK